MHIAGTGKSRPSIVIVGANFAGLIAAQRLGLEYDVMVIDRSPWFEWLPNIHELLSGVKRPADLRLPRGRLVTRAGHRFVRATVIRIDARAGQVMTADDRVFDFDLCIVATGGVNDTFGVRGADRHALPFKSVDDCAAIGRRLATLARTSGRRSVTIVGGGLEGIEALGEILRRYRHLEGLHISVIEAGPRLVPGTPPALDILVRKHCAAYDVRICTRSRVTAVTPRQVKLDSGETLPSDLTIWTSGVAPPPLLRDSRLAQKPHQWAPVTRALRSTRFDNLFVVGDAAELAHPLAKQAYHAMDMGRLAADNAARALAGRRLRDFRPSPKPVLIAFGDLDTFLVSGRTVLASPALATAKEVVFQLTMAQFDPPLNATALQEVAARLMGAGRGLALPTRTSTSARSRWRRTAVLGRKVRSVRR